MALGPNLNAPMTRKAVGRPTPRSGSARALSTSREPPASARSSRRWRCATPLTATAIAPPLDRAYAGRDAEGRRRVLPTDPDVQTLYADAVDEHDAVGLLAEGRHAQARDGARRSTALERVIARSPTTPARITTTSICSRRRPIPSAQRRAPIVSAR